MATHDLIERERYGRWVAVIRGRDIFPREDDMKFISLSSINGFLSKRIEARSAMACHSPLMLLRLALSEEPINKKAFCAIVEENDQEIVALATSIRYVGLQNPVKVLHDSVPAITYEEKIEDIAFLILVEKADGVKVVTGGRRIMALAYNHAKYDYLPKIRVS